MEAAPAQAAGAPSPAGAATCGSCPHACAVREGSLGLCGARGCREGRIVPVAYGRVTSMAIDPVEKKPLARWRPGSLLLSVGGYGCNMRCAFCQNHEISQAGADDVAWREVAPDELVAATLAAREDDPRVQGIAYTYNEPLCCWEFVRDTAELARSRGLANVLVSNGCFACDVIGAVAPLVDAANIDLKAFDEAAYRRLGGSLACVRETIRALADEPGCHLEVTTLVVPGVSDSVGDVEEAAAWLASLDPSITYHLTRFFPRWKMSDASPTPVDLLRRMQEAASRHLCDARLGNVWL